MDINRVSPLWLPQLIFSPLVGAIRNNQLNFAQRILEGGADVNELVYGRTPLHYAIDKSNVSLVQLLLEHGADVSVETPIGQTPLSLACAHYNPEIYYEICRLLLGKGADCNFRNKSNKTTPFLRAVGIQTVKVIKLLIDHGADITMVDGSGYTALHIAAVTNRNVDVLEFLLAQGLNIDSYVFRETALFRAAYSSNLKGCEILLKRGTMIERHWHLPLGWINLDEDAHFLLPRFFQLFLDYGAEVTREVLIAVATLREHIDALHVVTQHVAKLSSQNSGIPEDVRQIMESTDCYSAYYQTCLLELENMKCAKLFNSVSVFDILTGSKKMLSRYARNKTLVNALEHIDCGNRFSIYFSSLKEKFEKFEGQIEDERLKNTAATILSDLFAFNDPSHPVPQNIVRYLDDEHVKFLCSPLFPLLHDL